MKKMKKFFFVFCFITAFLFLTFISNAETLEVEKLAENGNISAGDDIRVLLKFKNPFNENLNVKIIDRSILGNSGFDIQCFEYTVPPQGQTVGYEPFKSFTPGNYTFSEAEISYTNPITGNEEKIKSNKLEIEVKNPAQQIPNQPETITTIYQCNGMSMRSTSSTLAQQGPQNQQQNQQNNQQNNQQQEQNSVENRMQNNQMNQNTEALKQEINKNMQKNNQMMQEFNKKILNDSDFQKKNKDLSDAGYAMKNSTLSPSSNDTGNFEFSYEKENKTASLKGRMENGTMKELMSQTDEEREKMLEALMKNEDFKKYSRQLMKQGFNMTKINFTQDSQNRTKIEISYEKTLNNSNNTNNTNIVNNTNNTNSSGNANKTNPTEIKKITADHRNGKIENVRLEENKKDDGEDKTFWMFIVIILSLIAAALYFKSKKHRKISAGKNEPEPKKEKNYVEEVKEMLILARKLFDNKREKDAYEKVSQAVRFYFSNKMNIKKEITNSELIYALEKNGIKNNVGKCMELCALVEFAKYKANKEDFDEIMKIAEEVIAG